jgi:hypothetical protein
MTDSPADPAWLNRLLSRTVLVPDSRSRRHWQKLVPYMTTPMRYELAATLLEAERQLERAPTRADAN